MNKKINLLALVRTRANVSLSDMAYLLAVDIGNLSKIERGIRKPSPRIILAYHALFDTPLIELFKYEFLSLKEDMYKRSEQLTKRLVSLSSPKGIRHAEGINELLKGLNSETKKDE